MMNPQLGRLGSVSPSLLNGGSAKPIFRGDLVDFFTFKGKGNIDLDRNTITGLLENKLTAYNFGWSLGSGYGLYKENYNSAKYRKFNGSRAVFTNTDNSIHITESLDSSCFIETHNTQSANAYSIKVTGLKPGIALEYRYVLPDVEGLRTIAIVEDGVYNLPQTGNSFNGFRFTGYLGACNITIKQIPEYEGAIVTDGIDDYLKLDKVGYKIGTVIIKFVPIKFHVGWNIVFDNNKYDSPNRNFLGYSSTIENRGTSMFVSNYGDYLALYYNTPKQANDSLYISSSYTESFTAKDFFSMALYDIAIYQDVLTAEEIQKEISEAFPKYEQLILNR